MMGEGVFSEWRGENRVGDSKSVEVKFWGGHEEKELVLWRHQEIHPALLRFERARMVRPNLSACIRPGQPDRHRVSAY